MNTFKPLIVWMALISLPSLALSQNADYDLSKYPDSVKVFSESNIYALSDDALKSPDIAEQEFIENKWAAFKWQEVKKLIITCCRLIGMPIIVMLSMKFLTKPIFKFLQKRLGLNSSGVAFNENADFSEIMKNLSNPLSDTYTSSVLTLLAQRIIMSFSCYLVLAMNPIPEGILGKIFFFTGGDMLLVPFTYFKFIKANFFPNIYMPAKVWVTGQVPFDPLEQKGQIPYIRAKAQIMISNPQLCKSIEKGFSKAYIDPTLINKTLQKTKEACILFFATDRKRLIAFLQDDTKQILVRAEQSYKNYPSNVKKPLLRAIFSIKAGKGSDAFLLYGPPGTGKSYSILQIPLIVGDGQVAMANLEGITPDGFRGTSEEPGELVRALLEAGKNGYILVLQLDELEKPLRRSSQYGSEMETVLLKFTDGNSATFYSPYFDAEFPKPPIIACTANSLPDSAPLKDRLRIISRKKGYNQKEKEDIIGIHKDKGGELEKVCYKCNISRRDLKPRDIKAIKKIISKDKAPGIRKVMQAIEDYIRDEQMVGRL